MLQSYLICQVSTSRPSSNAPWTLVSFIHLPPTKDSKERQQQESDTVLLLSLSCICLAPHKPETINTCNNNHHRRRHHHHRHHHHHYYPYFYHHHYHCYCCFFFCFFSPSSLVHFCSYRYCFCAAGSGLAADISLGAVNGAAAVQYVCQMVAAAPPLRVLVLVVKALLKVSPT